MPARAEATAGRSLACDAGTGGSNRGGRGGEGARARLDRVDRSEERLGISSGDGDEDEHSFGIAQGNIDKPGCSTAKMPPASKTWP